MSNLGNFSPFKRTYQFMHLQNSAYHLRNKRQAKPMVKTNLKQTKVNKSMNFDNQNNNNINKSASQLMMSDRYAQSKVVQEEVNQSYVFQQPRRVIHKNEIFQRARSAKINNQNKKMVGKLIDADCMIVSRSSAADNYKRHRKYSSLIRKYQENGQRHITAVVNPKKLTPAIADYHSSRIQSARQNFRSEEDPEVFSNNWMS